MSSSAVEEEWELRLKLQARPEHREILDTMHRMLAELVRAEKYAKRCEWVVPHPVHTHFLVRGIRQLKAQIAAEIARLTTQVEVDPPTTTAQGGANDMNTAETIEDAAKRIEEAIDGPPPSGFMNFLNQTWSFVKNPKVWGTAVVLGVVGVGYAIYRMTRSDGEVEIIIQPTGSSTPSSEPTAPVTVSTPDNGPVADNA